MKATKIGIAICLLLSVASCNRQSSDPKKDIVGGWTSSDKRNMILGLSANGSCSLGYTFLSPSQYQHGTYTLTTDPSGINILTLNLSSRGFGGQTERSTKSYEAAVYTDELILGVGAGEMRFVRAPKETVP